MNYIARLQHWMRDLALPLWADIGMDKAHGGPVEELTLAGAPNDPGFKRVRVPARQLYVFSHAIANGHAQYAAQAESCRDFLLNHCWMGDDWAFAKLVYADGRILDDTTDLYDNAFILFALAWHVHATSDATSMAWMQKLLGFIQEKMAHPSGLGFYHILPKTADQEIGPRIQNPHMHLLEACLAVADLVPNHGAEATARDLVHLCQTRFYDFKTQTLGEYFNDDFSRLDGDKGRITEPGHQFEWAWILAEAQRILGIDVSDTARGLIDFADQYGVGPHGRTYNVVRDDGMILDGGSRTWPNTERLKAARARATLFGQDALAEQEISTSIDILFRDYLDTDLAGAWMDARDANGDAVAKAIPTSTLYHLWVAFADILAFKGVRY